MTTKYKNISTSTLIIIYLVLSILLSIGTFSTLLPDIYIDELAYSEFAESFWQSHQFLFRGNNFNVTMLLYSLIISPFYWLPSKELSFTAIKLFNAFTLCATFFPVFYFSESFLKNYKKSLVISLLSVLAGAYYSSHIMIENIFLPLFWIAIYTLYLIFLKEKLRYQFLFILIMIVSLPTKPSILPIIGVFFLLLICHSFLTKDSKNVIQRVMNLFKRFYVSIIGIVLVLLSYYLITTKFYESQVQKASFDYKIFFQSFSSNLSYLGFFALGIPLVLYLLIMVKTDIKNKNEVFFGVISFFTILGVIAIIAYSDVVTRDFRIHERYFLVLYPFMFMSLFLSKKINIRLFGILIMAINIIYFLLPFNKYLILADAPLFAIFNILNNLLSPNATKILIIVASFLLSFTLIWSRKFVIVISIVSFISSYLFLIGFQITDSRGYKQLQYSELKKIDGFIRNNDNVLLIYSNGDKRFVWNSDFLLKGNHYTALLQEGSILDGWDNHKIAYNDNGFLENQQKAFQNIDYIVSFDKSTTFFGDEIKLSSDYTFIKNNKLPIRIKSITDGTQYNDGWIGPKYTYSFFTDKKSTKVEISLSGRNLPEPVSQINGTITSNSISPIPFSIKKGEDTKLVFDLIKQKETNNLSITINSNSFVPDNYLNNGDEREISVILDKLSIE